MTQEDQRVIFEASLGSPGANERLADGRYKFEYVESLWQEHQAHTTQNDLELRKETHHETNESYCSPCNSVDPNAGLVLPDLQDIGINQRI